MKALRFIVCLLLLPLTMWYAVVVALRNLLFDWGCKKAVSPALPTIGIGNLRMGGTGKTPHTEYIIRLLEGRHTALLSRGYGRSTNGFVLADSNCDASQIGDEPLMMAKKYPNLTVAVCESRVEGVEQLMQLPTLPEVVVLDDVFQHRHIKPELTLLLTEYGDPYFADHILPFGNLRESRRGRRRADIIVVTKCPKELTAAERQTIRKKLKPRAGQEVYFSYIEYGQPVPVYGGEAYADVDSLLVVTGIAHPEPLLKHLQEGHNVTHLRFADHHGFSISNCQKIRSAFERIDGSKAVITTEKDAARMLAPEVRAQLEGLPLYYLPIEVHFFDEEAFNKAVIKKL